MSKENINLPKTEFSMKANLQNKEPGIVDFWNKIDLYNNLRATSKGKEKFVLHDGPPYANGNIHMGTAFNKIIKDLVVKFHQMSGKDSVYIPGWDTVWRRLPKELRKLLKKDRAKVSLSEFSNFGLLEMTRQRTRLSLLHTVCHECPECSGLGVVSSYDTVLTNLENWLKKFKNINQLKKQINSDLKLVKKKLN